MKKEIAPLRLGARICFEDRWQGRLSGFDLSEEWEIVNIIVSTGLLFSQSHVKLPFSVVTRFDRTGVYLNVISFTAFAREVSPIAAPARPISSKTPVGHSGASVAGVLVRTADHRATDFLLDSGGRLRRVSRDQVSFEGDTLGIGTQLDTLPQYDNDDDLLESIHQAVGADAVLPIDDKSMLVIGVDRGNVSLAGNVRLRHTRKIAESIVQRVPGVVSLRNDIVDDLGLETAIGLSLSRAGHTRSAEVQARSRLGNVTLWGAAPSLRSIDDIVRDVARVPGVRHVESRIELRTPAAA